MQEFPNITKAQWLTKVEKDLKGKPLDGLNWSVEGESFTPFWHGEDQASSPVPIKINPGWRIGVRISKQNINEANKLAIEALEGGADSLWFDRRHELKEEEKMVLLHGIHLDMIECVIDVEETRKGRGSLALDLFHAAKRPELRPTFFPRQQAGFFESVAIYRAIRLCWQLVTSAFSVSTPCSVKAFLFTNEKDASSNKISNTSNAMAAIIGGANTIYLQPSDGEGASSFERRVARNVQNILREEAYLHRVADPAAGSYYIEALTDTYARKIWAEFQQLVSKNNHPA